MLFTTHALTGAAMGVLTQNPALAFVFGFISHHILDSIPHFDQGSFYIEKNKGPEWAGVVYEEKKKFKVKRDWIVLFIDWFISGIFCLYIAIHLPLNQWMPLICGALGGLMSDILDVSPWWKEKFRKTRFGAAFHKFHHFFHWPLTVRYIYIGVGIQIIIAATDMWFIKKLF